jgi:hypothetical protein
MDQPDDLRRLRCLHHPGREAAVRCPGCARHFCRECVGEHAGRWLCASCQASAGAAAGARRSRLRAVRGALGVAAGLFAAWFYFFLVGQALLRFHDPIHGEGTLPAAGGSVKPAAGMP